MKEKLENLITKLLYDETYQQISNRCYTKGYDEGYAEGFEKGLEQKEALDFNFVKVERAYLEKLLSS